VSRILSLIALALATAAVAASVAGADSSSPDGTTAATKVQVRMATVPTGLKLTLSANVVKAGPVTFVVSNQTNIKKKFNGVVPPTEAMALVLLKTNLAPDKLPTTKRGRLAVENGRVGKTVNVAPGEPATITLNLKPGKYVVISNAPWGYTYGAHAALKVTL
jgi:uncharacterized cupredoxin-like copper-binding protein